MNISIISIIAFKTQIKIQTRLILRENIKELKRKQKINQLLHSKKVQIKKRKNQFSLIK